MLLVQNTSERLIAVFLRISAAKLLWLLGLTRRVLFGGGRVFTISA